MTTKTLFNSFFHIIITSIICKVRTQTAENIRFLSIRGCDPSIGQGCQDQSQQCTDISPPGMVYSCHSIATNDLCGIIDPFYCQHSCGVCGGETVCKTTMLGCKCLDSWEYITYGDNTSNQSQKETFSGCQNPNNDPFGFWCEFEPNSCVGLDLGNGVIYKPRKYDYCTSNCSMVTVQVPEPVAPEDCNAIQENSVGLATNAKPNITLTVISRRIITITSFNNQEIDLTGWKILDSGGTDKVFSNYCDSQLIIQPLESIFLQYDYGSCDMSEWPSQFIRLVNQNERVMANVEIPEVDSDEVICFQEGKHVVVNTVDCQWL